MSAPDTATVRATYATVATYHQSPRPARVADFNEWLDRVRADAWDEGYNAWKNDLRDGHTFRTVNPHRKENW